MFDNYDLFVAHDREQTEWLESQPTCCECGEHIQDDFLYDIEGDLYCEECLEKLFKRLTDNYVD